ncbi:MAG: NAD(P)-binding domain-containing protein [Pseudomonadota bacterium]
MVILCATIPPDCAQNFGQHSKDLGLRHLYAPISDGSAKAAQGALSIMAFGTPATFAAAKPASDAMAETAQRPGNAAGAGSQQ